MKVIWQVDTEDIVHELCHLKIDNQNTAFYRLLIRCMPDWKQWKEWLEALVK
jgi:predicted metal-dependent hydrolase